MDELITDIKENMTINDKSTGKVILSLGTKFSGKSYFVLKWLKYCLSNKKFDIYFLVLPSYSIEAQNSYDFIDKNSDEVFIFEEYQEGIPKKLMALQRKLIDRKKEKKKIFFLIDDASGERIDSLHLDQSLKRLITSVRHYNTVLHIIAHGSSGVLSTFQRQNTDILLLYNLTNQNLLESIFIEFLSLNKHYRKNDTTRKNLNEFLNEFLELHDKPFQALYLNLRNRKVSPLLNDVTEVLKKYYP